MEAPPSPAILPIIPPVNEGTSSDAIASPATTATPMFTPDTSPETTPETIPAPLALTVTQTEAVISVCDTVEAPEQTPEQAPEQAPSITAQDPDATPAQDTSTIPMPDSVVMPSQTPIPVPDQVVELEGGSIQVPDPVTEPPAVPEPGATPTHAPILVPALPLSPTPVPSTTSTHAAAELPATRNTEPSTWFKDVLSRLKQQQQQQQPPKDAPKGKNNRGKQASPCKAANESESVVMGMSSTTKDLYEGPAKCKCCINWVECPPGTSKMETAQHALLLRHKKAHDSSRPPYVLHSIKVQSPLLRSVLGSVFAGYPGITTNLEELVFDAPFRSFFYRLKQLKAALKDVESDDDTQTLTAGKNDEPSPNAAIAGSSLAGGFAPGDNKKVVEHLTLLHDIVSEALEHTSKQYSDLTSKGVVTFEHVWTLFPPGTLVFSRYHGPSDDDEQIFRTKGEVFLDDKKRICVPCSYIEWDGDRFGWDLTHFKISPFDGTKNIVDLPVVPLEFHDKREDLEEKMMTRGCKWEALAGVHHRAYEGRARCADETRSMFAVCPSVVINGRIMVDAKGYRDAIWRGTQVGIDPLDGDEGEVGRLRLTDSERILCTAAVRGYSLTLKQWATFSVNCIEDIKWSTGAFDSLALPEMTKDTILTLVDAHLDGSVKFDDFVAGKGQGLVFLLGGPSGVGKTLTAESVSEHVKAPLYSLSAGDLGEECRRVEKKLVDVFQLVVRWKGVLLLDEADVFLAKRTADGLKGNQLVSVFLRMLEYYEGILFLTSNRVDTIDPAVESRVHVSLDYLDPPYEARQGIWHSLIGRCPIPVSLSNEEREELAQLEINGRQIRNVFKIAALLAAKRGGLLNAEHFNRAVGVVCAKATRLGRPTTATVCDGEESHKETEGESSAKDSTKGDGEGPVDAAEEAAQGPAQGAAQEAGREMTEERTEEMVEERTKIASSIAGQDVTEEDGSGGGGGARVSEESCVSTVGLKSTTGSGRRKPNWKQRWSRMRYVA